MRSSALAVTGFIVLVCLVAQCQSQLYWSDGSVERQMPTAMLFYTGYWRNVRVILLGGEAVLKCGQ